MKKFQQLLFLFSCSLSLYGCFSSPTETSNDSDVFSDFHTPTEDLYIEVYGSIEADDTSKITVYISEVDEGYNDYNTDTAIKLGEGDKLYLYIDGVKHKLEQRKTGGTLFFPQYIFRYELTFSENIASKELRVSYERKKGADAYNTYVNFQEAPTIINPQANTQFSLSSDDIDIQIEPSVVTPSTIKYDFTYCASGYYAYSDENVNRHVFKSGTMEIQEECQTEIVVSRFYELESGVDPAFGKGSFVQTHWERRVPISLIP